MMGMSKYRKLIFLLWLILAISVLSVAVQASGGEPPQPLYIEDTIHVYPDQHANVSPNDVRKANDHGCNDYWAIYYSTGWRLPTGVWSWNPVNLAHIQAHNGLDGYFRCYSSGYCITYLCTKDKGPADAWSVKVKY
jgi:hypothetical protein